MGEFFLKRKSSGPPCGTGGESSWEGPPSWDWPVRRAPYPDPPPTPPLGGSNDPPPPPHKPIFPMPWYAHESMLGTSVKSNHIVLTNFDSLLLAYFINTVCLHAMKRGGLCLRYSGAQPSFKAQQCFLCAPALGMCSSP